MTEGEGKKKIKFRNYQPRDVSLAKKQKGEEDDAVAVEADAKDMEKVPETIQEKPVDIIQAELEQCSTSELNILPKNNNWDLKQILAPKMERLQKRTQRAIVDILREKLAAEGNTDSDAESETFE